MRLLLEHDAYIDSESAQGVTPLMLAARYGSPLSVKLLLEEGADPTLSDVNHATALDWASQADYAQRVFYIKAFTEAWQIQNPTID